MPTVVAVTFGEVEHRSCLPRSIILQVLEPVGSVWILLTTNEVVAWFPSRALGIHRDMCSAHLPIVFPKRFPNYTGAASKCIS